MAVTHHVQDSPPWFAAGEDSFRFGGSDSGQAAFDTAMHFPALRGSATLSAPTMADEITFVSAITGAGNIANPSFAAWNEPSFPATYTNSTLAGKWGSATPGTSGGTIKYFFDAGSSWTATEKAVFTDCLKLWSNFANIKFALASSAGTADLTITRGHSGAFDQSSLSSSNSNAGKAGGAVLWTIAASTLSVDTTVPGFGPITKDLTKDGGYPWTTILHELGHAIGLGHGGPYDEGSSVDPLKAQYSPYDSQLWSLMSYIDPSDSGAKFFSSYPVKGTDWGTVTQGAQIWSNKPVTPMMLDILAAQALYGKPATTVFNGGDTFGFHTNLPSYLPFYDFTMDKNPVVTIWDSGTGNTLDLSGFAKASHVNLTAGQFSSCNGQTNNICIAQGTKIDSVVTGKGNDTVTANKDGDHITGGLGADKLTAGAGHDVFVYTAVTQSTGSHFDIVSKFDANADAFDLWFSVSGTLHTYTSGSLSKATFDSDLASDLSGKLGAHHFDLFTPSSGDYAGKTFLVVDANGTPGYQAGADLVIELAAGANLSSLATANFT